MLDREDQAGQWQSQADLAHGIWFGHGADAFRRGRCGFGGAPGRGRN